MPINTQATAELKDYHFTDEQIDAILRLARNEAFKRQHDFEYSSCSLSYSELADLIEDQIVNHPAND
jgi:hypothetical protein